MTRSLAVTWVTVLLVLSAALMPQTAHSQGVVLAQPYGFRLYYGSYYSPATEVSYRIQAEAQYLRGYGQMQKDFADARVRHAEAARLEGENAVLNRLNKIKIRELMEADREKRIMEQIDKRRKNNEKTWERLKNHPELTAGEIRSGRALNFLLNRLSTNLITYHTAEKDQTYSSSQEVERQMRVTPEMIHALQVRQVLDRGEALVFRLDDGHPIQVDWWPPALRTSELKSVRSKFEGARQDVFEGPEAEFETKIKMLLVAHSELEDEFLLLPAHAARFKAGQSNSQQAMHDYLDGKAFLKSLLSEVRRLQKVGPGQTAARDLSFKGSDLTELLTHMVRNGMQFAPPKPGDEPVYTQMFGMLRDLYLATEADAEETAQK